METRFKLGQGHLGEAESLLRQGQMDASQEQFELALAIFRSPESMIGEAHALRGLARVALAQGNLDVADRRIQAAIRLYQSVRDHLRRLPEYVNDAELEHDSHEGEAVSLVVRSEVLVRQGNIASAQGVLALAREIYSLLGECQSRGFAWLTTGKLALRSGNLEDAKSYLQEAKELFLAQNDQEGACSVAFLFYDLYKVEGDFAKAAECLEQAGELARLGGIRRLELKSLNALAGVKLEQGAIDEAQRGYEQALQYGKTFQDNEGVCFSMLGLGQVKTQRNDRTAFSTLVEAGKKFAAIQHPHGFGSTMYRIAEHGLRHSSGWRSLLAAEVSRRQWERTDPIRGVGQSMRLLVKSLALIRRPRAAVTMAWARVVVVGESQPNATEVREFYRTRVDEAWVSHLDNLLPEQLLEEAIRRTSDILEEYLGTKELSHSDLDIMTSALELVGCIEDLENPSQ